MSNSNNAQNTSKNYDAGDMVDAYSLAECDMQWMSVAITDIKKRLKDIKKEAGHQNIIGFHALENIVDMVDFKFAVVEGDLETSRDADRLKAKGINAVQIQTGSACHLDAFMVHKGLHDIKLADIDVCFVENVGNLVCPASYDVGTHLNIVLVSVPEGEDKIAKYPVMFRSADLILITKTDLLPYFEYDIEKEKMEARKLKPNVDILEVNIKDKQSLQNVIDWINFKRKMR